MALVPELRATVCSDRSAPSRPAVGWLVALLAWAVSLTPALAAEDSATSPSSTQLGSTAVAEAEANAEASTDKADRSGWIAFPVAGYSPETSLELGGLVIYFFEMDKQSSLSSFPVLLIGTLKRQVLLEIRPELFLDNDNYRLWTRIDLQRFPDEFFGVGNDIRDEDQEPYQRSFLRVRTILWRRIFERLYGGVVSDYKTLSLEVQRANGLFATRDYVGEGGGTTSGIGPSIAFDTRDHKNYPRRGTLLELSVTPYVPAFGSDYSFTRTLVDTRGYIPTYGRQLLALRYMYEATVGNVPFYMLPQLGGGHLLRGYFAGKYRDKHLQALEAEYRAHLFWRFRGAVFGGVGQVGDQYETMWKAPWRPSFGAGVRYNLKDPDDIVNFRVDFGWWPWSGDSGLYVAATEIF